MKNCNAVVVQSGSAWAAPVGHTQTVLPALHQGADDLQVVAEHRPLAVEAVLHQELQQPIGQHLIPGVTLGDREGTSMI